MVLRIVDVEDTVGNETCRCSWVKDNCKRIGSALPEKAPEIDDAALVNI